MVIRPSPSWSNNAKAACTWSWLCHNHYDCDYDCDYDDGFHDCDYDGDYDDYDCDDDDGFDDDFHDCDDDDHHLLQLLLIKMLLHISAHECF